MPSCFIYLWKELSLLPHLSHPFRLTRYFIFPFFPTTLDIATYGILLQIDGSNTAYRVHDCWGKLNITIYHCHLQYTNYFSWCGGRMTFLQYKYWGNTTQQVSGFTQDTWPQWLSNKWNIHFPPNIRYLDNYYRSNKLLMKHFFWYFLG